MGIALKTTITQKKTSEKNMENTKTIIERYEKNIRILNRVIDREQPNTERYLTLVQERDFVKRDLINIKKNE